MDNFNTMPTGTPEERALVNLKKTAGRNIDALRGRVSSKWHHDAINAITKTTDARRLCAVYEGWQKELAFKQLTLPDLRKPKLNQINAAA